MYGKYLQNEVENIIIYKWRNIKVELIIKITSFILIKVDSYVNTRVSINAINLCFILIKFDSYLKNKIFIKYH